MQLESAVLWPKMITRTFLSSGNFFPITQDICCAGLSGRNSIVKFGRLHELLSVSANYSQKFSGMSCSNYTRICYTRELFPIYLCTNKTSDIQGPFFQSKKCRSSHITAPPHDSCLRLEVDGQHQRLSGTVFFWMGLPSRPKLLQKMLFKNNCFGANNFVKVTKQSLTKQIPSHVLLQIGTNHRQQHYKENSLVELLL